jgi:hypothetical protein
LSKSDVKILFKIIGYFDTSHFRKIKTIIDMKERFNIYKKFDYMSNLDISEYNKYDVDDFISFLGKI